MLDILLDAFEIGIGFVVFGAGIVLGIGGVIIVGGTLVLTVAMLTAKWGRW